MDLSVIGYFSKTHGVKGQLIIKAEKEFFSEDVKAIFIETSTGVAPYFVKELSPNNSGYIIELEDVDAIEKAKDVKNSEKLTGKDQSATSGKREGGRVKLVSAEPLRRASATAFALSCIQRIPLSSAHSGTPEHLPAQEHKSA